ncbi:hypothetical protein E1267_08915 [Nonomuraea longispora]|uniref:Uncharacterized protein n=1 Tax=Nonomuraea longispora TaxID=1848320 RepID=A0A4R4NPC5_9ACTN|nr:hypothetical protein [Nonomuraea longispora]TDC08952.1 hypothetical protein E1267_08915 [Nonomuraea longispora]
MDACPPAKSGIKRKDAFIVGVVHLLAVLLGIAAGPGWLDLDLAALFVGYAALAAAVLVIIRRPLLDPPPATLAIVIFTVVTPALAGLTAHGIARGVAGTQGHAVAVKWSPNPVEAGGTAVTEVRFEPGYTWLRVPVSYTDPAEEWGSCPHNRVDVLMDGRQPNEKKEDFDNGDFAEFEVDENMSRVTVSMELISTQNCSISITTKNVTLHR